MKPLLLCLADDMIEERKVILSLRHHHMICDDIHTSINIHQYRMSGICPFTLLHPVFRLYFLALYVNAKMSYAIFLKVNVYYKTLFIYCFSASANRYPSAIILLMQREAPSITSSERTISSPLVPFNTFNISTRVVSFILWHISFEDIG